MLRSFEGAETRNCGATNSCGRISGQREFRLDGLVSRLGLVLHARKDNKQLLKHGHDRDAPSTVQPESPQFHAAVAWGIGDGSKGWK